MTPADIDERLREAGLAPPTEPIVVERRGERDMVLLPDDRLAWFPTCAAASEGLATENRVLSLLAERCSFRVPRVLFVGSGGWTLRSRVAGRVDPSGFAGRLKADPDLLARAAAFIGTALAEQHLRVAAADVADRLPAEPPWPSPRADIMANLPSIVADAALLARIARALAFYDDEMARERARVLVHGDLGFHNLAFDPATGEINGIFDYGSAAWADPHFDFRYLVFGDIPEALLAATVSAYRTAGGADPRRERVLLHNAVAAISHLADRAGQGADVAVAGRNLAQDLTWTRWALARSGF